MCVKESGISKFATAQAHQEEKAPTLRYVVITPARNEEQFIELTLKSMVVQTVRPLKWVIVSDGSTDRTDEIVAAYATQYKWIELIRLPERKERHFAGKVHAFDAGYARVAHLEHDVVCNLDADITLDEDHFEFLLGKFEVNPRLGVAGVPFREGTEQYDYRFTSVDHVSGACQLFRRECFEEIGGYTPIKSGGIDLVAVVSARMNGWETRTFLDKTCYHHRKMGTATRSALSGAFKGGYGDYLLGVHPLWQICRSLYQITKRPPLLLGGSLLLIGYFWAMITRAEKTVSPAMAKFRGKEQVGRLKRIFRSLLGRQQARSAACHGSSDESSTS